MQNTLKTKIISSLEKCFFNDDIDGKPELNGISVFRNQRLNFQLAYIETNPAVTRRRSYAIETDGLPGGRLSVRYVENVPNQMPVYPGTFDENYISTTPGLYPDLLRPIRYRKTAQSLFGILQSLWFELDPGESGFVPGKHKITLKLLHEGAVVSVNTLKLEVIDATLPAGGMSVSQWLHCDCLASYYKTEIFSEEHWRIIGNFIKTAVRNGINVILTPVFTPPLDTYVGGERPTVQLVDVFMNNCGDCDAIDDDSGDNNKSKKYKFGYENFDRWVDMCLSLGVKSFEISHLFTQWGASHAPKIMAYDGCDKDNSILKKIFGWETDAAGAEYGEFLREFIVSLLSHAEHIGIADKLIFHISDEPGVKHLDNYIRAKAQLGGLLDGRMVIDALSKFELYQSGAVERPVPSNNHIDPFLEAGIPNLWTYYCCSQSKVVSNRFIAMPSARNRIIGVQFYKYNIAGFLHWGYNFYYNQYSHDAINPFLDTSGEFFAPGGDTFSVYPGDCGEPLESLRIAVFYEALEDVRALKLCEKLYGREFVLGLIQEGLDYELTFSSYPTEAAYILNLREKVNTAVKNATK